MRSERCRVVVKCRPTREEEQEALGTSQGISLPAPGRIVLGKEFEADHVYLPTDGDAVYEDEVAGLVGSLYEGINSTVFAYGASGSGKTHTVLGSKQNPGLVDRITDEVFGNRYDQRTCTISISVEELYCERFTDLLAASAHPPTTGGNSSSGGGSSHLGPRSVHFRPPLHHYHRHAAAPTKYSWQKVTLTNSSEMKALVQHVLRKRHTASTCLNDKSSRSHVIVTITLEQRKAINEHTYAAAEVDERPCSSASSLTSAAASSSIGGSTSDLSSLRHLDSVETRSVQDDAASEAGSAAAAPVDTYLIGKLYLVDLAGSENIKRSRAEGHRQKEAGDINKSLCHLKTVIEEVFKGRRVTTYRNSKLTFRLQDALGGGNSKLLVVACISTAANDLQETKETLRFAEMARAITNSPVVNREPKDELIHRLQEQVAELQDQVKAARKEGGRAATEEVLAQLNATEAALADLKEEMEAKEAKWTSMGLKAKNHVQGLSAMLDETKQQESSLQQQLAAEQAAVRLLRQQLAAEAGARQDSQQAGSAAAGLLLDMHQDLSTLQQHCIGLQQQVERQHALAATAARLSTSQQQQAQGMQQQLSAQALDLDALRQELQRERSARVAAETQVAHLQQQQQAVKAATQKCVVEASQDMQELFSLCNALQEQAVAAAAQRDAALQQHQAVVGSLKASAEAQAAVQQELAATKQEACTQQQHCEDLQQRLRQQQEHHAAELSAAAAASAKAAAQAARELLKQRQAFEEQLRSAQQSFADLQKDLEDERTEHEAMLQAAQQKAAQQLAESMHSSVKKLTADKLQCREHLRMHLHDLKAETQNLSQVLASPNPAASILESQPGSPAASILESQPGSPAASLDLAAAQPDPQEGTQEDLQDQELTPAPQQRKSRVSPVPHLQLERSEAMLSDTTTTAPMQDASERNLSGGETSSEGDGSSGSSSASSSPGAAPMSAAAQQAAMMAVAAAAAAGVAKRLTPRRGYVHVHAEAAGSQGGHSDGRLSMVDSTCASEGGRDCSADLMRLPSYGSEHAALSVSSMDGSQGGSSIPATAASAAAAAVLQRSAAARVRTTSEQQRRHRKRRKELLSKSFSAFRWPISYVPEEDVDMEAAADAFGQMRGGRLTVKNLQAFLAHRMLEQGMHDPTLLDGKRKRKHELVQDMLAYHKYHLAAVAAGGRGAGSHPGSRHSSSNGSDAPPTAEAAVSPTPRSMCSSPDSGLWHPLAAGRPASAAPSSATSSPARLELARYSYDSPGRGRSSSGGGGIGSSKAAAGQLLGHRTAFAVEAPDANSSRQQPDAGSPAPEQQHSPGWWSRLTPLRGKKGGSSILGQLHSGDKSALRKSLSVQQGSGAAGGRSPEPLAGRIGALSVSDMTPQQQQQRRQSGHNSRYESEGGCDAVSPRDKKHAAAASRADSSSVPSSSAPSSSNLTPPPGGISLNGRAISAVTGSAVAEFYVDSPAVKLGRAGGSNKQQRGSGSIDRMRLGVDLGASSALRSSWKQAQLLRPK